MNNEEKKKLRNSPEMKRQIDEFIQENLGLNYEDLRIDNPNEKQVIKSIFMVLDVDDEEIELMDLNLGMPTIVEANNISKKANLQKGDKIKAEIYSIPENSMTSEWFFAKIEH